VDNDTTRRRPVGSAPVMGRARGSVAIGSLAGSVVAVLAVLGGIGNLGPAGWDPDLRVVSVTAGDTSPAGPGEGREQIVTIANDSPKSLEGVRFAMGVDTDGAFPIEVRIEACETAWQADPSGMFTCASPVEVLPATTVGAVVDPVTLTGLTLEGGERRDLRVTMTLPAGRTDLAGLRTRFSYHFDTT
jgi:hypothetical protein